MKLNKTERDKFNSFFNNIFSILDFDPNELQLNGSFGETMLALYAGDVDLYEPIDMKDFDKWYTGTYKEIKEELKHKLLELKVGDTKHKQFIDKKTILSNLSKTNKQRIKFDFIFILKGYPTEITMIYDFGKAENKADIMKQLLEDINKYYDEQNYYKVLKRVYSLYKVRNTNNKYRHDVKKILENPLYGNLYLIISRLKTIQQYSVKQQKPFLELIKEDLRKIGLSSMYKNNVSVMIKKLQMHLNKLIFNKYVLHSNILQ